MHWFMSSNGVELVKNVLIQYPEDEKIAAAVFNNLSAAVNGLLFLLLNHFEVRTILNGGMLLVFVLFNTDVTAQPIIAMIPYVMPFLSADRLYDTTKRYLTSASLALLRSVSRLREDLHYSLVDHERCLDFTCIVWYFTS